MKTVLITGANRGIGKETARQLAKRGWKVWIGSRSLEKGREAAKEVGGEAEAIELDVSNADSIRAAAGRVESLDVLVNNAGIFREGDRDILQLSVEQLTEILRVNTFGALIAAQAFWPKLQASGHGRIINVSSGLGQLNDMENETPGYAISKTALNAVTRQLAGAGKADSIAVNSVCPGWVRTDMGGPNATRAVEEGADTIVWLADEAPQDLTGQFLRDRKSIPW